MLAFFHMTLNLSLALTPIFNLIVYPVYIFEKLWPTGKFRGFGLRTLLCFGFLFFLGAPSVTAEEDQGPWTLPELVKRALVYNDGLAAIQMGISIAEEDVSFAKGERLPKLESFVLSENFPQRERLLIFRHGFRANDNPFENYILSYGLEASVPLFTSGRIKHGIFSAQATVKAAEWRLNAARQELVLNLASAFYTALELQELIAAQEATLSSLEESLRIATLQEEVGRIATLDLLRIETRASQAERDLISVRNAYEKIIEVIKELAVIDPGIPVELEGELVQALSEGNKIETLRSVALSNRPELIVLGHELRSLKEEVKVARARFGPSVNATAGYRAVTGIETGITIDDSQIMVRMRLPLYSGGVLSSQKRKALAKVQEKEFQLRDVERQVLAQVERTFLDLESAQAKIKAGQRALSQAEESLRVEREKFSLGRGTSNDLLLAEEAFLQARLELAAALAESQIARATLAFVVGVDPLESTLVSTMYGEK